jgi:hypothetical protein
MPDVIHRRPRIRVQFSIEQTHHHHNPAGTPNAPGLIDSMPNHFAPENPVICVKYGYVAAK